MKGRIEVRFNMPYLSRFRSRVDSPSKELTPTIRQFLPKAVAELVNEHQIEMKTKLINFVNGLNLNYKSPEHKARVMSAISEVFTIYTAESLAKLSELVGDEDEDGEDDSEEDTDKPEPKADPKPKAATKTAPNAATKTAPVKEAVKAAPDGDEFD